MSHWNGACRCQPPSFALRRWPGALCARESHLGGMLLSSQARASQVALVVKNSPANAGDVGSIPGSDGTPGRVDGNPLQYSCLGNPMSRGAWRATVYGVTKSWTRLSDWACMHPAKWEREGHTLLWVDLPVGRGRGPDHPQTDRIRRSGRSGYSWANPSLILTPEGSWTKSACDGPIPSGAISTLLTSSTWLPGHTFFFLNFSSPPLLHHLTGDHHVNHRYCWLWSYWSFKKLFG